MKLGINSQDFARFYSDKTWFSEEYDSEQVSSKARPGDETQVRTKLRWEKQFGSPFFFSNVPFSSWLLISSSILAKLGPSTPSFGGTL
jgi:hypothetical protein